MVLLAPSEHLAACRSAKCHPSRVYVTLWYLHGSEQPLANLASFSWGSEIALTLQLMVLWKGSYSKWCTSSEAGSGVVIKRMKQ